MDKLIDFSSRPVRVAIQLLLQDKSTKKNIIWATDPPELLAPDVTDKSEITPQQLIRAGQDTIQPRIAKVMENQTERTRKKGEVFTPAWICNLMNNACDEEWFGRQDVFNTMAQQTWDVTPPPIEFPPGKTWKHYVDSRRLEITCGEAPYLVSRYDASTGQAIPPDRRIGILDRKLRVVNENTDNVDDWFQWTLRAFQSVYGYEYQGDNLLVARVNLLLTFVEYYTQRWQEQPAEKAVLKIANVIAWNLWQMDGLNDVVPFGKPYEEFEQLSMFDSFEEKSERPASIPCKVFDWRKGSSQLFMDLKKEGQ